MNSRTATRPESTIDNARFGAVRADEVRVRDIVTFGAVEPGGIVRARGVVTGIRWEGDDIVISGFRTGRGTPSNVPSFEFTTSEGNGVDVVGRA